MIERTDTFIAIDPGPTESAWVRMDGEAALLDFGYQENADVLDLIRSVSDVDYIVQEDFISQGMSVSTVNLKMMKWMGKFDVNDQWLYLANSAIRWHLCNDRRAKDTNIRQAIMDRYGSTRHDAIGTKKHPGPLYGVTDHVWSALAVGMTYLETAAQEKNDD